MGGREDPELLTVREWRLRTRVAELEAEVAALKKRAESLLREHGRVSELTAEAARYRRALEQIRDSHTTGDTTMRIARVALKGH